MLRSHSRFFFITSFVLLAVVLVGFSRTFFLRAFFGLIFIYIFQQHIPGLLAVGGVILLWIAARMWFDIRAPGLPKATTQNGETKPVTFQHALVSIVIANIVFSLDNVIAVAGVSRNSYIIMLFGLALYHRA